MAEKSNANKFVIQFCTIFFTSVIFRNFENISNNRLTSVDLYKSYAKSLLYFSELTVPELLSRYETNLFTSP